ncbi:MAG TPA: hypothetical protein VF069_24720 [Streptosporangiaceae bacterium]
MSESPFADFNDEELHALLRKDRFRGPLWDRCVEALAHLGVATLAGWIASKKIFQEMRRRRYFCCGPVVIDRQDAADLAADVVVKAIEPYRKLLTDRWDSQGPASLKSAFIDECLRQFPNQYRRWLRANLGLDREKIFDLPGDEEVARWSDGRALTDPVRALVGDPEALTISREQQREVLALLPDTLRGVVQLVLAGYSFREAAAAHGMDDSMLRKQLYRLRPRLRELWEELHSEPDS